MRYSGQFLVSYLFLLFPFVSSFAQSSAGASSLPALTTAIQSHLSAAHGVGAVVCVSRNGSVIYEHAFGLRRMGGESTTVDTLFEIGSDTKQFTAAAILQLMESGKLSLEDRLAKFVPTFPHAEEITLRQLLNQTSGLVDFVMTNHFVLISTTSEGSLERIAGMASGPLRFPPGSKWEYSNTNYIALGRVIEVVSGESFHAYVREHLFKPAGMEHSAFIADEKRLRNLASGYWWGMQAGSLQPAPVMKDSWTWSAGDIVSTVGDLANWNQALLGGRIVAHEDFVAMTTPATLSNGKTDDYGFGWWIDNVSGHKHIYHDGDTFGMSSSNNLYPDDNLQIIVLVNESRDAAAKTAAVIFRAVTGFQK